MASHPSHPLLWFGVAFGLLLVGGLGLDAWIASSDYNSAFLNPSCVGSCFPDFTFTTGGFVGLLLALLALPAGAFAVGVANIRAFKHEAWPLNARAGGFLLEGVVFFGAFLSLLFEKADVRTLLSSSFAWKQGNRRPGLTWKTLCGTYLAPPTPTSNWWCVDNSVHPGPGDNDGTHAQHNAFLIVSSLMLAFVSLGLALWAFVLARRCFARFAAQPHAASWQSQHAAEKRAEAQHGLPTQQHGLPPLGSLLREDEEAAAAAERGSEDELRSSRLQSIKLGEVEGILGGMGDRGSTSSSSSSSSSASTNPMAPRADEGASAGLLSGGGSNFGFRRAAVSAAAPPPSLLGIWTLRDGASVVLAFLVLFPGMAALSARLPNIWYRINPPQIAHYWAQQSAEVAYPNGWTSPPTTTPPTAPVPYPGNKGGGWVVLGYELFDDVFAYYAFLYGAAAAGVLARLFPAWGRALHARVRVPEVQLGWKRRQHAPGRGGSKTTTTTTASTYALTGLRVSWSETLTLGECSLLLALLGLCAWWLDYWVNQHVYPKELITGQYFGNEALARAVGQLANLFLALVFLPASRNSVWERVFGVPFERAVRAHRRFGRLFFGACTAHMLLFWGVFSSGDTICEATETVECLWDHTKYPSARLARATCEIWNHSATPAPPAGTTSLSTLRFVKDGGGNPVPVPCAGISTLFTVIDRPYHPDNFSIPLMSILYWLALLAVCCTLDFVRREHFELFMWAHHFLFTTFVLGALLHAHSLWFLLLGSLLLWAADRALRADNACSWVRAARLVARPGGVTELAIAREGFAGGGDDPAAAYGSAAAFRYEAGQYAFLNIPALSTLQWHPFSISSAPSDPEVTFHIKDMGPGTFTAALHALATRRMAAASKAGGAQEQPLLELELSIDGGYGRAWDHEALFDELILVGGGIGITPLHSTFRELRHRSQAAPQAERIAVELHWVAQSAAQLELLSQSLADAMEATGCAADDDFQVGLYATREADRSLTTVRAGVDAAGRERTLPLTLGRPNWREILTRKQRDAAAFDKRIGVMVCGPAPLVNSLSELTRELGIAFHKEVFEF